MARAAQPTRTSREAPLFVVIMGIGALAMLIPAGHAWGRTDYATARTFLFGATMGLVLSGLIGIATQGRKPTRPARAQLLTLLAAFTVLPLYFALPVYETVWRISLLEAWFEMVSSFTTTGATLYENTGRLNPSIHLWRAIVGWLGGLLVWISAVAVLAPMNIGGFEVRAAALQGGSGQGFVQFGPKLDPGERLWRFARLLFPVYAGLTVALWVLLAIAGDTTFVALCHAMSVMATSGISPVGGVQYGNSGILGEVFIFAFLIFGVSRLTFSRGVFADDSRKLLKDPEVQMAIALVLIVPTVLILRHFFGAAEGPSDSDFGEAIAAFWGAVFTVLSFLTTTGFEAEGWIGARDWSGLETPGLILVGLSLIGGGVATTAGGVKLLRVYALFKHGERELGRLVHPNSIGGAGAEARRIRRQGAYISWIFFMLFALSIAAVMLLLTLTGVQFETAMVLAVAAISTTGPLAEVAAETPILYSGIPDAAKVILAFTMVLGRLELLALIALFNPDFWRS